MRRSRRAIGLACLCLALASLALAQRGGGFGGRFRYRQQILPNAPYDGRFTFVRVNYESTPDGYWYRGQPAWAHGYPVAEENLMRIMNEVSYLGAHDEAFNSVRFDDPELSRYPIAYVIEARLVGDHRQRGCGASRLHAEGRIRHRRRLQGVRPRGIGGAGGGDLREGNSGGGGWPSFEVMMKQVMPEGRFIDLDTSDPVFHSFFEITTTVLNNFPQAYINGQPKFRGLYEDNDPSKRLLMVVNYNTDISQYLGVVGPRLPAVRRDERSVQAGRELPDLRAHALSTRQA